MKNLLKKLIRGYQKGISPALPPSCIYEPTCSNYALQALEKHGAIKGTLMAMARILRCHPFAEGGLDEVPDYFTLKRNPESVKHQDEYYFRKMAAMPDLTPTQRKLLDSWLDKYGAELHIHKHLPGAESVLSSLGKYEEWSPNDFQNLMKDEENKEKWIAQADYWRIFVLTNDPVNQKYQPSHLPLFSDEPVIDRTVLVTDRDLGILETTNHAGLGFDYLARYGATKKDKQEKSYYLYQLLAQMAYYDEKSDDA